MNLFYATLTEQIKSLPVYLTSVGLFFDETIVNRPTGYNDYQWIQTVSGEGIITINNQDYVLNQNRALFIPPNIPHKYTRTSTQWFTQWISINGAQISYLFNHLNLSDIQIIDLEDNRRTLQIMEDIYYLASENYNTNAFKISTIIYSSFESIYSELNNSSNIANSKTYTLNKAIDYIDQYYMMDLSIDEIAKIADVTPQYLCRVFKDQLQVRPFEYIKRVRINKSKSLLLNSPSAKIEEISEAVGIHSASYFSSIFKSLEKITPRDFIKLHQRGGL